MFKSICCSSMYLRCEAMRSQSYEQPATSKQVVRAGLIESSQGQCVICQMLHQPGIEPGPPAWQARILPLNQQHDQCALETLVSPSRRSLFSTYAARKIRRQDKSRILKSCRCERNLATFNQHRFPYTLPTILLTQLLVYSLCHNTRESN